MKKTTTSAWCIGAMLLSTAPSFATESGQVVAPKPASEFTKAANEKVLNSLPFNDKEDFDNATRGFLAKPAELTIKNSEGQVVWDLEEYKRYITSDSAAPDTVNPSLWRNAQLNMEYGLFEVRDGIYQVRGYDLSNITFIAGDKGWIVFDPLITPETAAAAKELVDKQFGKRPVVAVIYSHSHLDHFGGVRGIVNEEDVKAGKVKIIASEGFTEHAVSENVIAGNVMGRRAVYMYGAMLPRNAQGGVNGGLGQTTSAGTGSLIAPTDYITKTGQKMTVDGVEMVFQFTPGTEAPTEMNTYFPEMKALWMAENSTNTMHNVLTLRGAKVRDPLIWASYLNETIEMWGSDADVKFQSHHWPVWGSEKIVSYLKKQRDIYKYIHDQSVRLMNQGYTGEEISEMISLPKSLEQNWATRGYYGTLRHNSRAVYQRYMGWYTGNPSDLNNLPPVMVAKKMMAYMGGEAEVLKKAQQDFDKGEYRWTAEVLKHLVFANPNNTAAKNLLADSYEQLGYQAESGPWRSVYLQGAYELRNGIPKGLALETASPDIIANMPVEMLFDYLGVRILPEKAEGKNLVLNLNFADSDEKYTLMVENSVLNYSDKQAKKADATATLTKATLTEIQLGQLTFDQAVKEGKIKLVGDKAAFDSFFGMLDSFDFWFNIVTP
ncbi:MULTISPECIES: alkyl/aryl-sulfatase [unclassified Shewanella]|uniref:alkyl/aryl-sulfatase n=1 Tax=unclassified Shewanella TaxID=196818 RepID=UPI001BC3B705|nr:MULTISPECIES: alkyl sulfatase dimerization domain-containing protein [unclassified Shewanella]GIU04957.1 alkyl sulfatase [Shewanella sp. MBTL60-112-B1]GIU24587.1 alkyl sulfatase [Shewanella sp. MBTL60-112-B2]